MKSDNFPPGWKFRKKEIIRTSPTLWDRFLDFFEVLWTVVRMLWILELIAVAWTVLWLVLELDAWAVLGYVVIGIIYTMVVYHREIK